MKVTIYTSENQQDIEGLISLVESNLKSIGYKQGFDYRLKEGRSINEYKHVTIETCSEMIMDHAVMYGRHEAVRDTMKQSK